jgi:hypothetical protein
MKLPSRLRSFSGSVRTKRKSLEDALESVLQTFATPKDLRTKLRKARKGPIKSAAKQTAKSSPVASSTAETVVDGPDARCVEEVSTATSFDVTSLQASANGQFVSPLLPGIVFEADADGAAAAVTKQNAVDEERWQPTTPAVGQSLSTRTQQVTDVEDASLEQAPADFVRLLHEKDERIRLIRQYNNAQQRELVTARSLVATYVTRSKASAEESREWQRLYDRSQAIVEGLKAKGVNLEQQLQEQEEKQSASKAEEDDEEESMMVLLTERNRLKTEYLQVTKRELEHAQADNAKLRREVERLTHNLEAVEREYDVLKNHKTCEYLEDPRLKEPDMIEHNETHDLQQALAQAQHLLELEREQCINTAEVVHEREVEIERLKGDNNVLQMKYDQLKELDRAQILAQDHIAAIKDLFTAAKVAGSQSVLAVAIEHLVREVVEEKLTITTLSESMREAAELREQLRHEQEQHSQEIQTLRNSSSDSSSWSSVDDEGVEFTNESLRLELEESHKQIAELERAGKQWRSQCERKAFGEHGDVLYHQLQDDLKMYKHMASEQQMQLQVVEREVINLKGWAADEVSATAMYVEERDWYRCQATALEAKISGDAQRPVPNVPFRPNWKSMSAEEQKLWLEEELVAETEGDQAFKAIVDDYLASELSDHAKLQEEAKDDTNAQMQEALQVRQEEEHQQAQQAHTFSATPVLAELPTMPVFPAMPNLPA